MGNASMRHADYIPRSGPVSGKEEKHVREGGKFDWQMCVGTMAIWGVCCVLPWGMIITAFIYFLGC